MPWKLADSTSHPLYQSRANLWVLISFLEQLLIHKANSSPGSLCHSTGSREQARVSWYKPWCGKSHLQVGDQGPFGVWRLPGGVSFGQELIFTPEPDSYPVITVFHYYRAMKIGPWVCAKPSSLQLYAPCRRGPASLLLFWAAGLYSLGMPAWP